MAELRQCRLRHSIEGLPLLNDPVARNQLKLFIGGLKDGDTFPHCFLP